MTIKHKLAALASALMLTTAAAALAAGGGGGSAGGSAGGSSAGASGGAAAGASGADGGGAAGVNTGGSAGATSSQPGSGGSPGSLGSVADPAARDVPAAWGSTTLTQPGTAVTRGIPGETGAAAGASSMSGAMTESQIRDRLGGQGYQVDDLVRRGDAWEGRIMRNGQAETVRIDPLTGQLLNR